MSLVLDAVGVAAVAAFAIALYKHHTLSAVIASAKKEVTNLEAVLQGAASSAAVSAAVAKVKSVLGL